MQGQIEFSKVVLSSEQAAGDKLMLIEGWAPAYSKVEIEAYLNDAHVYYEITDPMPGDEFMKFCEGCVMVAHNADFDMSFIKKNCQRLDIPMSLSD